MIDQVIEHSYDYSIQERLITIWQVVDQLNQSAPDSQSLMSCTSRVYLAFRFQFPATYFSRSMQPGRIFPDAFLARYPLTCTRFNMMAFVASMVSRETVYFVTHLTNPAMCGRFKGELHESDRSVYAWMVPHIQGTYGK